MAHRNIERLPPYTKKYSDRVRRQMEYVYNTTYSNVLKETEDKDVAERRALMAVHSVLKKRFSGKEQSWNKNDNDYIIHLVDSWLGNLTG